MSNIFVVNKWESDFFCRDILSISMDKVYEIPSCWPKDALISIKVDAGYYREIDFLDEHFSLVEGEHTFIKDLNLENFESKFNPEVIATPACIDEIKKLAKGLYINSRFREPWFSQSERESFYSAWINNAVMGTFDDCCLLLKDEYGTQGFVTVRIRNSEAIIGLIGVSRSFQGRGVGKKLLKLAESYSLNKGVSKLIVATQISNTHAINLYINSGFFIRKTSYWFYKQV